MPASTRCVWTMLGLAAALAGCATQKESHTARTGVEQLLVSNAIDQALDRFDYAPLRGKDVYLETKYLDCVDKNYLTVALHRRLLAAGARLVESDKAAQVVVEVGAGGVGTDGQELFVGIPEIPLPPPSPVSIPRMSFFTRKKLNGTAKLLLVAYDAKTRQPIIEPALALARSDMSNWNVMGSGPVQTGSVPRELAAATGEADFNVITATRMATQTLTPRPSSGPILDRVEPVGYRTTP